MSKRARTEEAPSSVLHGQFACHNGAHLPSDRKAALHATALALAAKGKGITACDESAGTIGTRLEAVGVANTEENRRVYRQMLFEAPGAAQYLSGAILDPETLTQMSTTKNLPFPQVLEGLGIVPGTKPHLKTYTLPGTGGDTVMQGLDSLSARLALYYTQVNGTITFIGSTFPSVCVTPRPPSKPHRRGRASPSGVRRWRSTWSTAAPRGWRWRCGALCVCVCGWARGSGGHERVGEGEAC